MLHQFVFPGKVLSASTVSGCVLKSSMQDRKQLVDRRPVLRGFGSLRPTLSCSSSPVIIRIPALRLVGGGYMLVSEE
jgi:hypothetical protein